jgi:hypothetical protein
MDVRSPRACARRHARLQRRAFDERGRVLEAGREAVPVGSSSVLSVMQLAVRCLGGRAQRGLRRTRFDARRVRRASQADGAWPSTIPALCASASLDDVADAHMRHHLPSLSPSMSLGRPASCCSSERVSATSMRIVSAGREHVNLGPAALPDQARAQLVPGAAPLHISPGRR